jgi:hypothetical protein
MTRQIGGGIRARLSAMAGFASFGVNKNQAHVFRRSKYIQRFPHRTRGFHARIPGDQDSPRFERSVCTIGNDKYGLSGKE